MEIIRELKEIPNLSLALGFFDGVHLGHKEVIGCAVEFAETENCKSAVVTFKEPPYCFFKKETPKYILTPAEKYKKIESLGVDYLIELDFENVVGMSPIEYLEKVLVKYFSPKAISTGFNHHFGVNKSGNVVFLSECQSRFNYTYLATPPQTVFGEIISSTAIRNYIKSGLVDMVSSMLGRNFELMGIVIKGQQLGRTIGFPTANIIYPENIIELPYGVFDVDVILENGSKYRGLTNFGVKPTVSNEEIPSLETFILDFDGDLYGKTIKLAFNKMIRPEIKFQNLDELKTQIEFDLQTLY
jgi:riboflavin kinase/FMN adenylyltransferase